MSDFLLSLILGLVQGLTEFLPISSSAHLILPSLIFGLNDLGLYFDISVHAGTLVAVIYYFRSDIYLMTKSIFYNNSDELVKHRKLTYQLVIATLPIVITGFVFKDLIEQRIFSIDSIAILNLFFAAILFIAFIRHKSNKCIHELTAYAALFIGIIQCFALIPGASRSGTAITAALLIGLNLKDASKFAFMLGIPTILGAMILLLTDLKSVAMSFDLVILISGFLSSMIFAFFTIKLFLGFVEKIGMIPFVIYRILLGITLLLI